MTTRRYRPAVGPGQSCVLLALVVLTVAPSIMGRAGFQLIEDAVAARIFALHRHGVPGEAEYIAAHGAPAPFVHPHCHRAPDAPVEHTPGEMAVAGMLLGPFLCGAGAALPAPLLFSLRQAAAPTLALQGRDVRPTTPPPQG